MRCLAGEGVTVEYGGSQGMHVLCGCAEIISYDRR
jgi:hypothetical protein